MAKSKWFRVAVEGATATDGRVIERQAIQEMAAGYNRATYGARVNMEHIRGYSPEPPFNAYGDVLEVKAEEVTIDLNGKSEKRLALFALIEPTQELVKLTKAKQKIYTSIELAPNFASTGKAGLVGLAVTDSPASLGTDILAFSAKPEAISVKAMLDARKTDPANLFSAALETSIEFEPDPAEAGETMLDRFTAALEKLTGKKEEPKIEPVVDPATPPADGAFGAMFAGLTTALTADRKADQTAADARFAKIEQSLEKIATGLTNTPNQNHSARPQSTGGAGGKQADF